MKTAFQAGPVEERIDVTPADLVEARDSLSNGSPGAVNMVPMGTPHFSFNEMKSLVSLIGNRKVHKDVVFYVSTSRFIADLCEARGWLTILREAGVEIVMDTCTYQSPPIRGCRGRVMTNSAKWAYYAPGMLPVEVVFASMKECVESAIEGEVWRDREL